MKKEKAEWEWKRVRVTYYISTPWCPPNESTIFSIEMSYFDSLKAVSEDVYYIGATKWCVLKVEPID